MPNCGDTDIELITGARFAGGGGGVCCDGPVGDDDDEPPPQDAAASTARVMTRTGSKRFMSVLYSRNADRWMTASPSMSAAAVRPGALMRTSSPCPIAGVRSAGDDESAAKN